MTLREKGSHSLIFKILEIETLFSNLMKTQLEQSSFSSIILERCHKLLSLMPTSQELHYTLAVSLSSITPFASTSVKNVSDIYAHSERNNRMEKEIKKQIDWSSLFGIVREKGTCVYYFLFFS
jgi:hypothetical protein